MDAKFWKQLEKDQCSAFAPDLAFRKVKSRSNPPLSNRCFFIRVNGNCVLHPKRPWKFDPEVSSDNKYPLIEMNFLPWSRYALWRFIPKNNNRGVLYHPSTERVLVYDDKNGFYAIPVRNYAHSCLNSIHILPDPLFEWKINEWIHVASNKKIFYIDVISGTSQTDCEIIYPEDVWKEMEDNLQIYWDSPNQYAPGGHYQGRYCGSEYGEYYTDTLYHL